MREADRKWTLHAVMELQLQESLPTSVNIQTVFASCTEQIDCGEDFYEGSGNDFTGDFRSLQTVWRGERDLIGRVELKYSNSKIPSFLLTGAWLDGCTHVDCPLFDDHTSAMYLAGIGSFQFFGTQRKRMTQVWSHMQMDSSKDWSHVTVYDDEWRPVAQISGLKAGVIKTKPQQCFYVDQWTECPSAPPLDDNVERIQPSSVSALHDAVLQRVEVQAPLCVLVRDEELAAYVRTLKAEYSMWKVTCVMCEGDPGGSPSDGENEEWRLSDGIWSVRRLSGVRLPPVVGSLHMSGRGQLSNLSVVEAQRAAPSPGTMEVRVCAVGLNFRDVLNVLGMYPGDPGFPGGDFSGVVTALGDGVESITVGESVFGCTEGCFATYCLAHPAHIRRKPTAWSFARACALPTLITTVHEALMVCAQLQQRQCVLVHTVVRETYAWLEAL